VELVGWVAGVGVEDEDDTGLPLELQAANNKRLSNTNN
jgi:hypothetical protein